MKDEFRIEGYWFLPADPENRVAGILHYVPNGEIRLQLIGSFDNPDEYLTSKVERKKDSLFIIHGESSNARKITLLNCYFGKSSYNFSCSFPMQSFLVQFILDGIYISNVEEEVFDKITFNMPYLTEWINHYSLGYSIPFKDERPQGFIFKYDKDRSNLISAKLNSNFSLQIEYVCSHGDFYSEHVAITQLYYLRIRSTI